MMAGWAIVAEDGSVVNVCRTEVAAYRAIAEASNSDEPLTWQDVRDIIAKNGSIEIQMLCWTATFEVLPTSELIDLNEESK